jgi:hypothetical protein
MTHHFSTITRNVRSILSFDCDKLVLTGLLMKKPTPNALKNKKFCNLCHLTKELQVDKAAHLVQHCTSSSSSAALYQLSTPPCLVLKAKCYLLKLTCQCRKIHCKFLANVNFFYAMIKTKKNVDAASCKVFYNAHEVSDEVLLH